MSAAERLLHDMAAEIEEAMTVGQTYSGRPELDADVARRLLRRYEKLRAAGVRSQATKTIAPDRKAPAVSDVRPSGPLNLEPPAGNGALRGGEPEVIE